MMNNWIQTGYDLCSNSGFESLKIEQLANKVGISKSSFYHHFSDLERFKEVLFEYHIDRCRILRNKEEACHNIEPELVDALIEHKTDLLFHKQLRMHRNQEGISKVLDMANQILGNYAVMLWAKAINLELSTHQLEGLFEIATDDFYMKIDKNNLDRNFLISYFNNLSQITKRFI